MRPIKKVNGVRHDFDDMKMSEILEQLNSKYMLYYLFEYLNKTLTFRERGVSIYNCLDRH
jgi:threonine synthase